MAVTSYWQTLPANVLQRLFSQDTILLSDVAACELACKHWQQTVACTSWQRPVQLSLTIRDTVAGRFAANNNTPISVRADGRMVRQATFWNWLECKAPSISNVELVIQAADSTAPLPNGWQEPLRNMLHKITCCLQCGGDRRLVVSKLHILTDSQYDVLWTVHLALKHAFPFGHQCWDVRIIQTQDVVWVAEMTQVLRTIEAGGDLIPLDLAGMVADRKGWVFDLAGIAKQLQRLKLRIAWGPPIRRENQEAVTAVMKSCSNLKSLELKSFHHPDMTFDLRRLTQLTHLALMDTAFQKVVLPGSLRTLHLEAEVPNIADRHTKIHQMAVTAAHGAPTVGSLVMGSGLVEGQALPSFVKPQCIKARQVVLAVREGNIAPCIPLAVAQCAELRRLVVFGASSPLTGIGGFTALTTVTSLVLYSRHKEVSKQEMVALLKGLPALRAVQLDCLAAVVLPAAAACRDLGIAVQPLSSRSKSLLDEVLGGDDDSEEEEQDDDP